MIAGCGCWARPPPRSSTPTYLTCITTADQHSCWQHFGCCIAALSRKHRRTGNLASGPHSKRTRVPMVYQWACETPAADAASKAAGTGAHTAVSRCQDSSGRGYLGSAQPRHVHQNGGRGVPHSRRIAGASPTAERAGCRAAKLGRRACRPAAGPPHDMPSRDKCAVLPPACQGALGHLGDVKFKDRNGCQKWHLKAVLLYDTVGVHSAW